MFQNKAILILLASTFSCAAFAADIEWSGLYRVEFDSLHDPDLTTPNRGVDYGLQHLIMRPKIIASDGLTIRSQFDVFNNSSPGLQNTQMGQYWGNNVNPSGGATTNANNSNVMSGAGAAGTINVSQLYLTWDMEYGSLVIGRVPLQFGLGMTYSAGMGMFDHYYNTLDMVGYKIVYGNLWLMPMIGKSSSGALDRNDDVDDYMAQLQYESPEGDFEMGAIYHLRRAGDQGSDAPTGLATGNGTAGQTACVPSATNPCDQVLGGPTANNNSGVGIQTINLYALKDTPAWRLGAEFGFQQGQTGVRETGSDGPRVTIGGFGIATELEWRPHDSDWKLGFKGGFATGDDPTTAGEFEGFIFNRNYDVAFLLFNHPMSQYDIFRTRIIGGGGGVPTQALPPTNPNNEINSPDTEAISNVFYFAPYVTYRMSDRWNMKGVLATGQLNKDPFINGGGSKDLGYEFDYSVNFMPRKGVMWINEMGLLFPGSAFKGDGSGTPPGDAQFTYGFQTKAAISF